MRDLWPDDFGKAEATPPAYILREQAEMLAKKTHGLVEGSVVTSVVASKFVHQFFLVVPRLENYSYQLLSATHGVEMYPVTIQAFVMNRGFECVSEDHFVAGLRQIFAAEETRTVLRALLAQVEDVAPKAMATPQAG